MTAPVAPTPEVSASPTPEATTPESSGAYIQEIHRETSLQESPVPSIPAQTVKQEDSAAHASGDSIPLTPESKPAYDHIPAHTPEILPAPAISSKSPSQAFLSSESKQSIDSPAVTNDQPPKIARPENNQAPQGTHVSQLVYLHQQQDILSKPTPKAVIAVAPGKVEAGSKFMNLRSRQKLNRVCNQSVPGFRVGSFANFHSKSSGRKTNYLVRFSFHEISSLF